MIKIIPVTFKVRKAKRSSGDRKQNFEFCQWQDFKNGGKRDHLPVFCNQYNLQQILITWKSQNKPRT